MLGDEDGLAVDSGALGQAQHVVAERRIDTLVELGELRAFGHRVARQIFEIGDQGRLHLRDLARLSGDSLFGSVTAGKNRHEHSEPARVGLIVMGPRREKPLEAPEPRQDFLKALE